MTIMPTPDDAPVMPDAPAGPEGNAPEPVPAVDPLMLINELAKRVFALEQKIGRLI